MSKEDNMNIYIGGAAILGIFGIAIYSAIREDQAAKEDARRREFLRAMGPPRAPLPRLTSPSARSRPSPDQLWRESIEERIAQSERRAASTWDVEEVKNEVEHLTRRVQRATRPSPTLASPTETQVATRTKGVTTPGDDQVPDYEARRRQLRESLQ